MNNQRSKVSLIAGILAGVLLLCVITGSWYTIDQGERGVITRNGAVIGTAEPGLGWKIPLIDDVETISVQDHVAIYENVEAYSSDQQPATMKVSVSYRLLPGLVEDVYSVYGGQQGLVDRLISRQLPAELKTIFGTYNAVTSIQQRGRLNMEIGQALQAAIGTEAAVMILGVQIEDISFSQAYEESVEQRMLAEVAVEKENQNWEKEKVQADIKRTQADATAYATKKQAEAEAEAIRLKGQATADSIRDRAEALRNNASLIELTKAENWDGKLPTTMLPNSAVPFINAK